MYKTVLNCLATTAAEHPENKWDTFVKPIQSILNCTTNKTTRRSPLEVLAGYKGCPIAESKLLNSVRNELERIDLKQM